MSENLIKYTYGELFEQENGLRNARIKKVHPENVCMFGGTNEAYVAWKKESIIKSMNFVKSRNTSVGLTLEAE